MTDILFFIVLYAGASKTKVPEDLVNCMGSFWLTDGYLLESTHGREKALSISSSFYEHHSHHIALYPLDFIKPNYIPKASISIYESDETWSITFYP